LDPCAAAGRDPISLTYPGGGLGVRLPFIVLVHSSRAYFLVRMRRVLVVIKDDVDSSALSEPREHTHVMVPEDYYLSDVLAILNEAYAVTLWGAAHVALAGVAQSEDPSGRLSKASLGIKVRYMLGDGDVLVVSPTQQPKISEDGSQSTSFGQVSPSVLSSASTRVTSTNTSSELAVSNLLASLDEEKCQDPRSNWPSATTNARNVSSIPLGVRTDNEKTEDSCWIYLT